MAPLLRQTKHLSYSDPSIYCRRKNVRWIGERVGRKEPNVGVVVIIMFWTLSKSTSEKTEYVHSPLYVSQERDISKACSFKRDTYTRSLQDINCTVDRLMKYWDCSTETAPVITLLLVLVIDFNGLIGNSKISLEMRMRATWNFDWSRGKELEMLQYSLKKELSIHFTISSLVFLPYFPTCHLKRHPCHSNSIEWWIIYCLDSDWGLQSISIIQVSAAPSSSPILSACRIWSSSLIRGGEGTHFNWAPPQGETE